MSSRFIASANRSGQPHVMVTRGGGVLPFSKGVLVQSLLATAMEPLHAFEIAAGIENEIVAEGRSEIDSSDLRERVATVLERVAGGDLAGRYRLWRRYQEPDQPVILLLAGTSGVGKSSLAVEVARRLGIARVLSTDSIRQIMRMMTSPDLVPALYGSSYDAWRHMPPDGDHEPSVIQGFRAQASAVSLGIRASLDRTIAESANLVVDGVSIVPGRIGQEDAGDRAHVVQLVVATLDEPLLRDRFRARAGGQRERLADRYLENFDAILDIQGHLLEQAKQHDVPVVDNLDFERSVRRIIEYASQKIEERETGTGGIVRGRIGGGV